MTIEQIFQTGKGTVVDVRTQAEFMGGHVADSRLVPVNEIPARLAEIKALPAPIIVCCASGGRSSQAARFLQANGVDCIDGGSWTTVNYYKNQLDSQ